MCKIKEELKKLGYGLSRRRIDRISEQDGLVFNYMIVQFKLHITQTNKGKIEHAVNRNLDNWPRRRIELQNQYFIIYIETDKLFIPKKVLAI